MDFSEYSDSDIFDSKCMMPRVWKRAQSKFAIVRSGFKEMDMRLGGGSMVECLLSMLENLDLIPDTEKNEMEGTCVLIFLWEGQCDGNVL